MGTNKEEYLIIEPGVRDSLLKLYDLDKPGRLDEAIDILAEWIKKQEHFIKKDMDRFFLEKILITNKGSVEKSKKRLDKACTMKTFIPNMFGTYCVKRELNFPFLVDFPFPRQTSDFSRVYFIKMLGDENFDISINEFINWYKKAVYAMEYELINDYYSSCTLVADYTDINAAKTFSKLIKTNPQQIITFITEGYGVRVKGIHLVLKSKYSEVLMSLLKFVIKEKLMERVHLHKSMESVFDFVPKEIFPSEFGGKEKSMYELNNMWNDALSTEEFINYVASANEAKTDETKRPTGDFNEEYLGTPGTFRSFVVD